MSALEERELLAFAAELARHPQPSAPAAFRTDLRASLLAAPVAPPRRPAFAWLRAPVLRPVVVGLLILTIVGAAGGSVAAASLAGDPAFLLKRAAEEIEVTFAFDAAARLDTLVTQSARRLGELEAAAAGRPSATPAATDEYRAAVGRVDAALAHLLAQPATAARDAAIARASATSADHLALLQALAGRLPASAQQGIQRAIEAQQAVHGRSGGVPGRRGDPTGAPAVEPRGSRPSGAPGGPPPGRGGPPSGVPGRR